MKRSESILQVIYDLKDVLNNGKLTRREFTRRACMTGMSAAAAGQKANRLYPNKIFAEEPKQRKTPSSNIDKNYNQVLARRGRENQILG